MLRTAAHAAALTLLLASQGGSLPALAADAVTEPTPQALATWRAAVQVDTLQARFVQTRTSRLLKKPLVAEGVLRFRTPDQVAWTVDKPARSVMTMSRREDGQWRFPT